MPDYRLYSEYDQTTPETTPDSEMRNNTVPATANEMGTSRGGFIGLVTDGTTYVDIPLELDESVATVISWEAYIGADLSAGGSAFIGAYPSPATNQQDIHLGIGSGPIAQCRVLGGSQNDTPMGNLIVNAQGEWIQMSASIGGGNGINSPFTATAHGGTEQADPNQGANLWTATGLFLYGSSSNLGVLVNALAAGCAIRNVEIREAAVLTHRYALNEGEGAVAIDSVGAVNGTIVNPNWAEV